MSEITVKKLAETVGAPVARLLTQMQEAGLPHSDIDEIVSDEQKQVLLTHLKRSHGEVPEGSEPKKITLKRKTLSTLKAGGSTRGKGVNVEVRKKRTYVKRAPAKVATEPETEEQIEARKIAEEAAAIVRVEDAARAAAEHEARQAVQASAEAEVLAQVEEQTKVAMLAVAAAAKAKAKTEVTPTASPAAKKSSGPKRLHEAPKRDDKAGDKKRGKGKGGRDRDGGDNRARRDVKGRRTGRVSLADDGGRSRGRRLRRKPEAMEHAFAKPTEDVIIEVNVPEFISVGELAQRMAVKATEVIKVLMGMGEMATINQTLEQEVAVLVVEEMGHNVKLFKDDAIETQLAEAIAVAHEGDTVSRAPIVTVMGHVDHGKTSLLDYIRKAKVADGEAGAITQHIGAYHAHTEQGMITFLDTPGHAAFTNMRSRGAKCTDVVILVVAADDGVMPQTEEAVQHAHAAGVPLVVAVNKIDKEAADPDRVKNELSAKGVVPDDWGGDTQFVHVSAHTGEGIDALLEAVHLQAELLELKAVDAGPATGVVVESRIDKGRGTVATLLVQQGQLNQGDMLLAGTQFGRVRAMVDEAGKKISVAGPSIPVEILGLDGAPEAGDEFQMVPNERKAREIAEFRAEKINQSRIAKQHAAKLENMFGAMASAERKILNIVLKTDVRGSLEALSGALQEIGNEEVQVNIVGSGVGGIAETDVSLASTTSAVIFGFNVRADGPAKRLIEAENVDLRYYSVIYDIIDDVKQALSGMLSPELRENIVGTAEVRDVFSSPKFGQIAGCMVIEGTVYRNKKIRVLRADVVIYEGELESLRRFKDDAGEVRNGMECGIGVKDYTDVQAGDKIEVFDVKEVARAL